MSITYGVVTISLNSEKTIGRTFESVLKQKPTPKEYVLVDGGSCDGTLRVIDAAIAKAKRCLPTRFQVVHQNSGGGIPEAWNIGLRTLTTDLTFILNSDDWYEPHTAAYVVSQFENDPQMEILLGSGRYFKSEPGCRPQVCRPRPFAVLPFAMTAIHPACFVKRDVYEHVGFFDEAYHVTADYEFIYRCHKAGVKFQTSGEILVNVQKGGFAERHKALGRREMAEIGERYSSFPIVPRLACLARTMLNR